MKQLFIFIVTILFISCRKFIDIKPAPNLLENTKVFSTSSSALSAASGVYTQMRNLSLLLTNGGMSIYGGMAADELYPTASSTISDQFYQNAIIPNSNSANDNFWNYSYRIIYQTNAVLEGLALSMSIPDTVKNQLTGEMKFVRAFCFFYLTNLYGNVPLVLSSDYQLNALMPSALSSSIYQQIITDLSDAKSLLRNSYPSMGKARPNKWTAAALLARVYLYQKNWANAEAEANSVINAGAYTLVPSISIANIFLAGSTETIWEIISDVANTLDGSLFIPSAITVKPTYALTNSLLTAFESNDLRKANWIKSNTVSTVLYYYPFKYKERLPTTPVKEYEIVLRLAEQYLISAEARTNLNNIDGAKTDLNFIRNRAGLPSTTAIDKVSLLSAIEHERQIELFGEWGHRWFDLKRTNRSNFILAPLKGSSWQLTDTLLPVPQSQLDLNINLHQNPGY